MLAKAPKSAYRAKLDGDWEQLHAEIVSLGSVAACEAWWTNLLLDRDLPAGWQAELWEALEARRAEIAAERAMRAMDAAYRNAVDGEP